MAKIVTKKMLLKKIQALESQLVSVGQVRADLTLQQKALDDYKKRLETAEADIGDLKQVPKP